MSVFHLANSLRHANQPDMPTWLKSASTKSSFLSAAIDHEPAAWLLIEAGLVVQNTDIATTSKLSPLSKRADRNTLVAIARLLLSISPPTWLSVSVGEKVRYEFVPSADVESLKWLRPELDNLLIDAFDCNAFRSDVVALGIGRAAELTVFTALDQMGAAPIHVSEISDSFGYDIETTKGPGTRWEVKGCTRGTRETFHLSRNEFEKSRRHPEEWRLIQVEFDAGALTADSLYARHISSMRELHPSELIASIPSDTQSFRWETSARVTPSQYMWEASTLPVPSDLQLPSVNVLGREANEMRRR